MELRPGVMVGDHARLLRPLGQGGMGTVWVAEHLRLEIEVAVKVIADPQLRKDAGLMERLRREAKAAARISSPHVVHIYDHGVMPDGSPFVLMELLRGESLGERIEREGTIEFPIAAEVVRQTVSALEAAHAMSMVHRDIKPDNLFLTGEPARPFVKVLDFGIALRHGVDSPDPRLTTTDRVVGTPAYMSPEQLLSAEEPGPHVDFWALAVTAYEMLTGAMPFNGDTLARVMLSVTSGDFVPPRQARRTLPEEADAWFRRAFSLDVEQRFHGGRELADSFAALCELCARPPSLDEALASTIGSGEVESPLMKTVALETSDNPLTPAATPAHHAHGMPLGGSSAAGGSSSSGRSGSSGVATASAASFSPPPDRTIASSPSISGMHGAPPAHPSLGPHGAGSPGASWHGRHPVTMGGASAPSRPSAAERSSPLGWVLAVVAVVGVGGAVAAWQLTSGGEEDVASTHKSSAKGKDGGARDGRDGAARGSAATGASAAPVAADVPAGMVRVDAGTYTIGCSQGTGARCFSDEGPAHSVTLGAFALMKHEVTRGEYAACVAAKQCAEVPAAVAGIDCSSGDDEPVRCVSWHAASAFCAFRGARLPTEQEWEAAARGADGRLHPWGEEAPSCERTVMLGPSGEGCGSKRPTAHGKAADVSPFGVHNMAGNVREWTSSIYGAYEGGTERPEERGKVINRGGSYRMTAKQLGASHTRIPDDKATAQPDLGIRCAADL